jgi:hypothetical protein
MIHVQKEPEASGLPLEACCFCRAATDYWTALADRTPGQQVACCERCAETHMPVQVPSKGAWFDLETVRAWARRGPRDDWERSSPTWQRVRAGIIRRIVREVRAS